MNIMHRAHAALSSRVTSTRIGVPSSTLRAWTEVGAGPVPDDRGIYRRDVVTAWLTETVGACTKTSPPGRGRYWKWHGRRSSPQRSGARTDRMMRTRM